jgi:LysR family glycine cleavage system transcriptional activator
MVWRAVPSLSALRAFEAVAQAGSFSGAARDLNVTHAAIAQHVRALEAELKTPLLIRQGRGMTLTDAGANLASALTDGFGQILAGLQDIAKEAEARPIAVSVTPNFAENWLMPRFSDFWAKHPEIALSILPSMQLVDLRSDNIDLAVRYGLGDWPGLDVTHLISADVTVVATPSLIAGRDVRSFADLAGLPWIFETAHQEARRWVMESGLDFDQTPINEVATLGMVMAAVRSGQRLTVAASTMVADDIASGKLVSLLHHHPEGLGYYIVHPKGVLSPRAKTLKAWLRAAV